MNIIWILIGGIWIALTHLLCGILFGITIVGIPFAKQHFKLASLALSPFGKKIEYGGSHQEPPESKVTWSSFG
jgi:uncharacterized membrane protein YccF (DUF307 family)